MDPVSSSPTLGVEFGLLPRSPTSARGKNSHSPDGKENTHSGGSLHKRLLNTIRGRSRSPKRASEDGSPSAKPIRRRKSIVELLNFSSRESRDDRATQGQSQTLKLGVNEDKYTSSNLSPSIPKRRRSLGNILNPTNIMATVTKRSSQKPVVPRAPFTKEDIVVIRAANTEEHIQAEDMSGKLSVQKDDVPKSGQDGDAPLYLKLAEGSDIGIDLFESRLARILDSIAAEDLETIGSCKSNKSYLRMLQDTYDKGSEDDAEDKDGSCSPNSLRAVYKRRGNKTQSASESCILDTPNVAPKSMHVHFEEEKRPNTPDSYLRLLIESSDEPLYYEELRSPSSSVELCGSSTVSCYDADDDSIGGTQRLLNPGEIEASNEYTAIPDLFCHQYEVRDITPDPQSDKELSRRQFLDSEPCFTVRQVSAASTSIDLDPGFNQRQEDRSKRYTDLGLTNEPGWRYNLEEIDRSIALTVAKMTRNYHSASDELFADSVAAETTREDEIDFNIRCCGSRFEFDQDEAWNSVMTGRRLMLQDEKCDEECMIKSTEIPRPGMALDETSLLDFDDLGTMSVHSVVEQYPSRHASSEVSCVPSIDEVIQESTVLRSPLEPFYGSRKFDKLDFPLDLEMEIDVCPAYERFLRRTQGINDPRPSRFPGYNIPSHPKPEIAWMPMPRNEKNGHINSATIQVRYPSTVNLHHHTESFSSMSDALQGLHDYKLGDLASFFVYDEKHHTIEACSIESSVPNPAELRERGLKLCWISHMLNNTALDAGDTDSNPYGSLASMSDSVRGGSIVEDMNSLLQLFCDPSDHEGRQTLSPVFGDECFLGSQAGSEYSGEDSMSDDGSTLSALRAMAVEEDVTSSLGFDDKVEPTKTWVDLAREAKISNILQGSSATEDNRKAPRGKGPLAMTPFEESRAWPNQDGEERMIKQQTTLNIIDGYNFDDFGDLIERSSSSDSFEPRSKTSGDETKQSTVVRKVLAEVGSFKSIIPPGTRESSRYIALLESLDLSDYPQSSSEDSEDQTRMCDLSKEPCRLAEVRSNESIVPSPALEVPSDHRACKDDVVCTSAEFAAQEAVEDDKKAGQNSSFTESAISYTQGYHFTAVQEHMMREIEDAGRWSDSSQEHNVEVPHHAAGHTSVVDDPSTSDEKPAVSHLDGFTKGNTANENWIFPLSSDSCPLVDVSANDRLDGMHANPPIFNYTASKDSSYNTAEDLEQAVLTEGEVTLEQLNLRPVGRAAKFALPVKKGKSKVGALVNIFQDYGLMPEKSRAHLPIPSISPAFNHQTKFVRGESSEASVDSITVRGVSATLSADSLPVLTRMSRVGSPMLTLNRPSSRMSDIDTEASFQFGEVLSKIKKHGESEDDEPSAREAELYG